MNIERIGFATKSHSNNPKVVYTNIGDVKEVDDPSKFTKSSNFGKVPSYLEKIKQELLEKQIAAKKQFEKCERENLSAKDREEMLKGLMHNWHLLQTEFQKLPLVIDTVSKIKRKNDLENILKQLEQDIGLLKSNREILIVRNPQ